MDKEKYVIQDSKDTVIHIEKFQEEIQINISDLNDEFLIRLTHQEANVLCEKLKYESQQLELYLRGLSYRED